MWHVSQDNTETCCVGAFLSVFQVSVTFPYRFQIRKPHIICSGIHAILINYYQRVWQYSLCRDGTEKNGHPYISIASDKLKSLVIYADKF